MLCVLFCCVMRCFVFRCPIKRFMVFILCMCMSEFRFAFVLLFCVHCVMLFCVDLRCGCVALHGFVASCLCVAFHVFRFCDVL